MKISIPKFVSLSLATKDGNKRRSKSAMKQRLDRKKTNGAKGQKVIKRLSKSQFLQLSNPQRKNYLKRYPKSKHRFLMPGAPKPNKIDNPKPKPTVEKTNKSKRISRHDFDKLSRKEQRAYNKEHGDKFNGKKHFIARKANITERPKRGSSGETVLDNSESPKQTRSRLSELKKAEDAIRDRLKQSIKHATTKEAVDSIKQTKPEDLKTAAKNLKENRERNLNHIEDQLKQAASEQEVIEEEDDVEEEETPKRRKDKKKKRRESDADEKKSRNFLKNDFNALRKIMGGEKVEPNGRGNAMVLASIFCRYMLIGSGVVFLSMGAAPAALHVARGLFQQWDTFNVRASADSDDDDVAGNLYDAIADYIQHMDHEEMVESVSRSFRPRRDGKMQTVASAADTRLIAMLTKLIEGIDIKVVRHSDDHISAKFRKGNAPRVTAIVTNAVKRDGYRMTHSDTGDEYAAILLTFEKQRSRLLFGINPTSFSVLIGSLDDEELPIEEFRY